MLRNTVTKSNIIQNGFAGTIYSSNRKVHWYHSYEYAGGTRDKYELYNRMPEFGQDEITDKERYPHLYWGIWQGRAAVSRVTHQWGFSKELKPEKLKRDFEKQAYFTKVDSLYFLSQARENYPWMDDDADGAIGYNTDDGSVDERYAHKDYGKLYNDASPDYKALVLKDQCAGRPVYEWQVPWGLDEAYGYAEVSTSVDVLGNENAQANISCDWGNAGSAHGGTLLRNNLTGQELLLVNIDKSIAHAIEEYDPTTVVMPCGAEKLLTQVRSFVSPTSSTDVYGVACGLAWSYLWMISEMWPSESVLSLICGTGLAVANGTTIYRTFFHHQDSYFKAAFGACRKTQCNVVLGDWLFDDYDERQCTVLPFDEIAERNNNPKSNTPKLLHQSDENQTGFVKTLQAIINSVKKLNDHEHSKTTGDVAGDKWIKTYRDAVNNRRIDLMAHVLNNTEGSKLLMPIAAIDNLSSEAVTSLLMGRLSGAIKIESSPLKFDPMYERVSVEVA